MVQECCSNGVLSFSIKFENLIGDGAMMTSCKINSEATVVEDLSCSDFT
jgi:hypothetical protein